LFSNRKTATGEVFMLAIRRLYFCAATNDRLRSHLARCVLALAAGSVLLAGTARAADLQLATGGVYGGISQAISVCYAFNSGTSPVKVSSLVIYNQHGKIVGKTSCPKLAPAEMCAAIVSVSNRQAYACTITSSSTYASDLRGVIDFRDVTGNVLINSNLH
jgi:hypothetical protein